jgi:RNA polymerase sigma factor (sigma-70 family)
MTQRSDEFVRSTEPCRRELLAHCYRMLGSADEAEDVVQETYLRAWRSYGTFEGRSSVRSWLYRIATNACLTALGQRGRRALPSGLGGPSDDPDAPPSPAEPGVAWLEAIPDALVTPESEDPGAIVAGREWLRLALIASLQYLPARQRAGRRETGGWSPPWPTASRPRPPATAAALSGLASSPSRPRASPASPCSAAALTAPEISTGIEKIFGVMAPIGAITPRVSIR